MYRIENEQEYKKACELASQNPDQFWADIAKNYQWEQEWQKVQTGSFKEANIKWFEGAKLNITTNCLDRHLENRADKTAIIFEPNDPNEASLKYTYQELLTKVNQAANGLKSIGVKKGDRVCFYMAQTPELLIGVLATARIGAIHSVVFGGFSAAALAGRINDCEANILVTNNIGLRGNKTIPLKEIANEALKTCPSIEHVLVYERDQTNYEKTPKDISWSELVDKQSGECAAETMDAEDPLFILYTSGSTGQPKGLVHTCGGYMVYAGYSFSNVFRPDEKDVFWCTADIGWITGHTYMTYGPLLNGATNVMFEGVPTYPDAGRFWQVVEKYKVNQFYTAPTAIRALLCHGVEYVNKYNLSSLKVLGSVGEPINEEAWKWYFENVGKSKCPIVDTWWQTETGGIMISALPGVNEPIPCFATRPLPGIFTELLNDKGEKVSGEGNLVISRPWPSIARTIYGDHNRYKDVYLSTYPGNYFTGDGCKQEGENLRITGRVDDVLNVSGHRLGTAEIEDALNQHQSISESAVVGYPHEIKGEGIYAYVIPSNTSLDAATLCNELTQTVTKLIGPIARPDKIQVTPGLPKTRSGKIMRRILRKVAAGETKNFGDTSTLLDPSVVEKIIEGRK